MQAADLIEIEKEAHNTTAIAANNEDRMRANSRPVWAVGIRIRAATAVAEEPQRSVAVSHTGKAQRAMETIMKSNRQPKQVKVKDLSTKPQDSVKGGLNFTKVTYNN